MRLAWVILGVVVSPPLARGDGPLQLEDAVKLALSRNERSAIAELDITIAEASVAKARTAFLPVLQTTQTSYNFRPRDKPINSAQAGIAFDQPLIVPTAFPLYSQAKENLAAQIAQSVDDKRQLAFDAAKAFFTVLFADQVVKAAERKLVTAKADLADTDAQFRAQLVSSNDVTRAKIGLGGSERELASDRGALDAAYVQLELVIKAKVNPPLSPPTTLLEASQRPPPPAEQLVVASIAKRPDLVARKHVANAAHEGAKEPRMRFFPTLGLTAQATASTQTNAAGHNTDETLAVTLSWQIWDGGERAADAKSRDAQATIADLNTEALVRTIDAQVRGAVVTLASAQQALLGARDAMEASRKSEKETETLYHQGLAKAIELIDANEQQFVAEVNYASAEFTVANAYLALRQAMGLDPIGTELQ